MSEVKAIGDIDVILSGLTEDECQRVIHWTLSKYGKAATTQTGPVLSSKQPASKSSPKGQPTTSSKSKKATFTMLKDLQLKPSSKQSFDDFMAPLKLASHKDKILVAVYYLQRILEVEVSYDHIYTVYKASTWKLPSDLKNMVAQTGSAGWIDASNGSNIVLAVLGENRVEHDL